MADFLHGVCGVVQVGGWRYVGCYAFVVREEEVMKYLWLCMAVILLPYRKGELASINEFLGSMFGFSKAQDDCGNE